MSVRMLAPRAPMMLALIALAGCATKPQPAPSHSTTAEMPAPADATPSAPPAETPPGPLPGSEKDFVVNVGDRVYFDLDQDEVRTDARPILDAQAAWLARYPSYMVRIEGNADERGTQEYNLALGARRANSVRKYLIAHGVAASRIATISYGSERPIDTGSNEAAWAHNRNAHTALVGEIR